MSAEERIAFLSDPQRHTFATNGFPVEACLKCGWPESKHATAVSGLGTGEQ